MPYYVLLRSKLLGPTDKTAESPLCRLCGENVENVYHVVSGCKKLHVAQKGYKCGHDNVAKAAHLKLCEKYCTD